jgi:alanine dehydrogenase
LANKLGVEVKVEPSPVRCYRDEEYIAAGVPLTSDLADCDFLVGIKEVPVANLLPGKNYLFFSHTIKAQPQNRKLLQAILEKQIRLIDFEVIVDDDGKRLIAFGYFAGMVGAHNTMWVLGNRTGQFSLPRMKDLHDYNEAKDHYEKLTLPPVRIVLTGSGRVGQGAMQVLRDMGIREVPSDAYLKETFDVPVFTNVDALEYAARLDDQPFTKGDYYKYPELFKSVFKPYYKASDVMINGIFWDKRAPAFFTREDMRKSSFRIRVVGDITCDIAPESSIPSTLRPSTIADPVYGYHPITEAETTPYQPDCIDVMAIDNLPSELPRDSSEYFGRVFIEKILSELKNANKSKIIQRATIAEKGQLSERYRYLESYVKHDSIAV